MKYHVIVKQDCEIGTDGGPLRFLEAGQDAELEDYEAIPLIRRGFAVPAGIQHGGPICHRKREGSSHPAHGER